jgi:diguanylate cyclase (GGDEF)-like protein
MKPNVLLDSESRAPGATPPSSLSRWLTVRLLLVMAAASVCILLLCFVLLSVLFDRFEHEAARTELGRVEAVLLRDSQTLAEMVDDYARWDDTYRAVRGEYPEFMDDNITLTSVRNLRFQAVAMLDDRGQLLAARQLDQGELRTALEPEWAQALSGASVLAQCHADREGMVWLPNVALMVARAPINNTAGNAKPTGCLVFARLMDADYFSSLQPFTGVQASLLREGVVPAHQHSLLNTEPSLAHKPLSQFAATLQVMHQPSLSQQQMPIFWLTSLALLLATFMAVGALYVLVQRKVVRRLRTAALLADRFRTQPDLAVDWPHTGQDEIDRLGQSLNELVAQVRQQAQYASLHDPLTGLFNRRGLMALLDETLRARTAAASDSDTDTDGESAPPLLCLVLLDLDGFKSINDGFGHDVGDALLCHVAEQLRASVLSGDQVARVGSDEFALVLHGAQPAHFTALASQVLERVGLPLIHDDVQVAVTASIGIARMGQADNAKDWLRNADLAMYQAKQKGGNGWYAFDEALQADAQRYSRLSQALRRALDDNTVQVVFQPVVDVVTDRVTSMEALMRWSLDGEAIPPDEFIPIAEETGLITSLGLQVLDKSCALLARLRAQGHDLTCSVNLSMRQFSEPDLIDDVVRTVAAHGLPATAIRLEITESMVANAEHVIDAVMRDLHGRGFRFMLDDFGTGQSSLHRLQALPFHTIKIDRSFVIPLQRGDQIMVRTVVDLAKALNMQLVAEGVEQPEELAQLLSLGVTQIQGYLTARPMSERALMVWLHERRSHPSAANRLGPDK